MVGFLYFYRAEKETERDRVLQGLYHSVDKIILLYVVHLERLLF